METAPRRRVAVFVVPMIITLVMAQRGAAHVRTVDVLLLFGSGALFGITLSHAIGMLRGRGA